MSIGILLCIVSCKKNSQNKEREKFDSILIKKSTDLQLGGEYEALIELNIEYLKKAAKMRYKEGISLCYLNMAEVNISAGNYEKALFFFNKAENDLKNSENGFHKAAFYDDYSQYYSHLKLYDKAITFNSKAFLYLKEAKDSDLKRKLLPRLYINKGINYTFKGWYGTSLKSFLKGNVLENSAYSNCMVAQYYLFRHQTDSAEVYITRSDEKMLSQKTSDAESLWVYYTMGYYYNEVNNNEQAEKALKKALEINIKTRRTYSSHIQNVYKSLAELYKKKNDGGKAYYYLRKYMEEEGRLDVARLDTMNKATENFISEIKPESDWHRSDLPLAIALSITALTVSGIYVQKTIKTQRLKKRALKQETEELKSHVRAKMLKEVTELAQKNDSSFLMKFKELNPDFINTLLKINPDLENSELTFCAMLKLHFSSKEIADYTFVQHRSVQQKKYRIRKRLNIPREEDIYVFFDKISS
ncbi:ggdef family protein [Chryseobacterium sp. StRB126]|uniref:tetratricopeptide repeat protein n=1 Tax=Chryseobacterium sp. StRB126 TaxID=878220 RepID=UPI0004E99239|nr:tetratricopeptide repeat protein [Chryseobacterium sp. StRB126]BAP31135.1 ggdef family protein [Chryseobacterium sp. StRB126]